MPVFAAIDVGANSVRLKVARLARGKLEVLHEDRQVTRLGESVFQSGQLDPEAMALTIRVLRRFYRAIQEHGANQVRVVATSALRDASNARVFTDWVRAATGWRMAVISGLEEGRLIHLGIASNLRIGDSTVLLVDVGGGSCELTVSVRGHIRQMASLPLGAVRLTREFLSHDPPKKKELRRLEGFIAKHAKRAARGIERHGVRTAIATSGTAAALAARHQAIEEGAVRGKQPTTIPRKSILAINRQLAKLNTRQRAALPGINARRAEIIVAGASVFAGLMNHCGLKSIRFSPLGLRDGVLAQMAADYDRRTPSGRQIQTERADALLEVARRYQVDLKHAETVRTSALRLFDVLKPLHHLPPEYRDWLSAAAMLHEVGGYLNRSGRHRHAYYIIANSEIFGFTARQRAAIAAIARYVGKSRPSPAEKEMRPLSRPDQESVPKAVMLLRLAISCNQGRPGAAPLLRPSVGRDRVLLRVKVRRSAGSDLELWALSKEAAYFREVFGRDLVPVVS